MSLDTETRVNAYFKSAIADTYNYYTNYDSENKDLPESNVGATIDVSFEDGTDEQLNDAVEYVETGTLVISIKVELGKSASQLSTISDQIKVAFRGPHGYLQMTPTGSEEGFIVFESLEKVPRGTISRKPSGRRAKNQSTRMWKRLDVMLTYTKYCS